MTAVASPAKLTITPASGRIGAEVELDLLERCWSDPDVSAALRAALTEHKVLAVRGFDPTPDEHVAFAGVFGEVGPHQGQNVQHPDHESVTVFDSAGGYRADKWHCDATYLPDVPAGAVLCMRQLPSVGGDTMFSNCVAAYQALSGGMKKLIDNRRALHEITPGHSSVHPVVITHPVSGEPVLFVNDIFTRSIVNLPPEEGAAVLPFLIRHVARPDFTHRHKWQIGDLVVWDNWATQHYALFDYDEQRVVDRVSLNGAPLPAHAL